MPYGYNGKILHVDLTTGSLTVEEPTESFYRTYMGGSAMGLYYILKDMPAGADPTGPGSRAPRGRRRSRSRTRSASRARPSRSPGPPAARRSTGGA